MYIESCKQVAADATGCRKGFRKKFRICNVFVLWGAAAMPTGATEQDISFWYRMDHFTTSFTDSSFNLL